MHFKKAAVAVAALGMFGAVAQAGSAVGATRQAQRQAQAQALVPALCSKSFNPYKVRITVLRSCGDRIMRLRQVTSLPGGGKAYSYGDYTRLVPPAHFNPLKSSDKQLREYGIPTRKQLGHQWYKIMRHSRYVVPATPYLVEVPSVRAPPPGRVAAGFSPDNTCGPPNCNDRWSGYYVTGHSYNEVIATWTEPTFVAAGCSGDAFTQWVGMGGWAGSQNLGQDGTFFNAPNFAAHQGFIETIINGSGLAVAASITATHGKGFYASTLWDSGTEEFSYFMKNNYTGATYSAHSRLDESPDLSTAEVISERPSINGALAQLSDYQQVPVQGATAYWDSSSAGFYHLTHQDIFMEAPPGIVLSDPGSLLSDSNFTPTWVACGP